MKYLIVGLGNVGDEYANTRHNTGFMILDAFAKASNVVFEDKRYGFVSEVSIKGRQLILLKPSTYMNLSGNAVRYWMNKEKVPLENLFVLVDDISLPFCALRLKPSGSNGGHNGLGNIQSVLGTENYARLRFGIGGDFPRGRQVDYVLGRYTQEDISQMEERFVTCNEIVKSFVLAGIDITMNQFNKKKG